MRSRSIFLIVVFIVFSLWEIVFESSNITQLAQLELVYIILAVFIFEGMKKNALVLFGITSFFIELINHDLIGASLFSYFMAKLIISLISRFIHLFDQRRLYINNLALILLAILIKEILRMLVLGHLFMLDVSILLINAFVFCLVAIFYNLIRGKKHAYRT